MTYSEQIANGVVISIKSGGTYHPINGITNGPNGPGWTPQFQEAMYHGLTSPKQHAVRVNVEPVTFDIFYDPSDTYHQLLRTNSKGKVMSEIKIALPDTTTEEYEFDAFVGFVIKGEVEGFLMASVTLTIDGTCDDLHEPSASTSLSPSASPSSSSSA